MRIEGREPGIGRVRAVRKANIVGGVVLLVVGLVLTSTVSAGSYPWFSDLLAGLGLIVTLVLAVRAFQPSVSIYDDRVKVRRWLHTAVLSRSSVKAVKVLETSDGPRTVRKVALVTSDDQVYRSHFQSPEPIRTGITTAADRAAAAIRLALRLEDDPRD